MRYTLCTKCETLKSEDDFYHRANGRIDKQCKQCKIEYTSFWQKKNSNKVNANGKKYKSSHKNDESRRNKSWYTSNKERKLEYNHQYAQSHRDLRNRLQRIWRKKNPDKEAEYKNNRRAKSSTGKFTNKEWNELLDFYGHRCLCCGKTGIRLTRDHIVPLNIGGSNTIENIQPLCRSCNSIKNTKTIDYRIQPYYVQEIFR